MSSRFASIAELQDRAASYSSASARYYFAPEQKYVWELIPAAKYEGQFGNLSRTIASDQLNLPELPQIVTKVNFSQFGFFIGVKIHL